MFKILVVDEERNIEYIAGEIDSKIINLLCELAQNHNLHCLNFLSVDQSTYFNHVQQFYLKKELEFLQNSPIKPGLMPYLEILFNTIKVAMQDGFSQLKIQLS